MFRIQRPPARGSFFFCVILRSWEAGLDSCMPREDQVLRFMHRARVPLTRNFPGLGADRG